MRTGATALALAALVAVIGSAQAAPSTKFYDATIDWPAALGAGGTAVFELTLKNDSASTQALGSANFWVPETWTADSVQVTPVHSAIGNKTWNIGTTSARAPNGVIGDAFTFRAVTGNELAPGDYVTATVNTTVACVTSDDAWQIQAKQANSFSGPPGNDFLPSDVDGLTGSLGSGGGAPDHLDFTTQPGNGAVAPATLPEVKVTVFDACGNAASASENLGVALLQPSEPEFGGGGSLGGTTSVAPSSGVATFGNLTVSASGLGYALRASYPGLDAVDSDAFDVYDAFCPPTCTASNSGTQIGIQGLAGSAGLSVGPVNTADCGTLTPLGSTFAIVPQSATAGTFTATLTIEKRGLQGVGASNIVVCVAAQAGDPLQRLSKCAKKNPTPKCILSQTSSNAGDAVITMLFDGDPVGGGFS